MTARCQGSQKVPNTTDRSVLRELALSDVDGVMLDAMRLPMSKLSPEVARRRVRETLGLFQADPGVLDDAELLASELVTNGVLHARGCPAGSVLEFFLIRDRESLFLECRDASRELPRSMGAPDTLAQSGRGMFLIARLSVDHGIYLTHESGKSVWCELIAWPVRGSRREPLPPS